jgi:hypothetical protein
VRFGSVLYSIPPGHVDTKVWCRVVGEELAIIAMTKAARYFGARQGAGREQFAKRRDPHSRTSQ